eukprot:3280885-Rhodomonas_salina.1
MECQSVDLLYVEGQSMAGITLSDVGVSPVTYPGQLPVTVSPASPTELFFDVGPGVCMYRYVCVVVAVVEAASESRDNHTAAF